MNEQSIRDLRITLAFHIDFQQELSELSVLPKRKLRQDILINRNKLFIKVSTQAEGKTIIWFQCIHSNGSLSASKRFSS